MAPRYWHGGSGSWSSGSAHWSSTDPATSVTGAATPGTGDNVVINSAAAGLNGGTITVDQNIAVQNINASTMFGTFDNSGNFNVFCTGTASVWFNWSGTTTRTIIGGSGIYRATGNAPGLSLWSLNTITGLGNPDDCFAGATIELVSTSTTVPPNFNGGNGVNYFKIDLAASAIGYSIITTAPDISTLVAAAPNFISLGATLTYNIFNMALVGTVANPITLLGGSATQGNATINTTGALTLDGAAVRGITRTGTGTLFATNSIDLGANSGVVITPPAGGGSYVIGG